MAEQEDDLRIIQNTRVGIALGRCYDVLSELCFLSAREFRRIAPEDRQRIREEELVTRNLLLKYNPSLKKQDLIKEEEGRSKLVCRSLISGGFWWGRRLVKYGLAQRYSQLLNLVQELSDGPVKDEILGALELIRQVGSKLDEKLKGLTTVEVS